MKKTPRNLLLAAFLMAATVASAQQPPAASKVPEAARQPTPATERKIRNFDDVEAELTRVEKQLDELQKRGLPTPPPPPRIDFAESRSALRQAEKELARNHDFSNTQMADARNSMTRARQEMARVQADMPRIQAEAARAQEIARRSLADAQVQMAGAREEMKAYRGFEDALVSSGLISRDQYTIEHRDGKLYIDDKLQTAQVYEQYRAFLDKHKRFRWTKSKDEFNINNQVD